MSLSSGLTLTDLSDYLAPSQACIKPVTYVPEEPSAPLDKPAAAASAEVIIGEDSAFYERKADGEQGQKLKKAEITLNDCLACSGCITTAESMLVSLQSHEEVYRVLNDQPDLVPIASISPQSVASLAALYDLSLSETMRGLRRFFKEHLGFRLVFDTTFPRALSLLETRLEHLERRAASQPATSLPSQLIAATTSLNPPTKLTPTSSSAAPLPILSSACPGWICYAEKTHGDLLPFVSGVKSPQAVAGVLVKGTLVAGRLGLRPDQIYHVAVMPCYDKKLEASRPDFATSHSSSASDEPVSVRDVDLVLTTGEVAKMLQDKGLSLRSLALASPAEAVNINGQDEDTFFPFSHLLIPPTGTSSGSYVNAALSTLLSSANPSSPSPAIGSLPLTPSDLPHLRLTRKLVRTDDYVEYTLSRSPVPFSSAPILQDGAKEPKGQVLAKAAKCYGFRNLQNVVRKLSKDAGVSVGRGAAARPSSSHAAAAANARRAAARQGTAGGGGKAQEPELEFIEVMACPSGCVNGGGQVAPPKEGLRARRKRESWGEQYVGRVDEEGMPDIVADQASREVLEAEVKVVAVPHGQGEVRRVDEEDRVLSAKEWVQEVEKRYWSASPALSSSLSPVASSTSPSAPPTTAEQQEVFGVPLSSLHPSIRPYLLSLPSVSEEAAMRSVIGQLVGPGGEEKRKELLRTSYRAVEEPEEVNGLAVVW
ncbi:hypothetical protein JCM11641_002918 [Rhodosporidiobolus odoratus]